MKISDVIKMLQYQLDRKGDLEVKFEHDDSEIKRCYAYDNVLYLDS